MPIRRHFLLPLLVLLAACGSGQNDPYPVSERGANILYSAFTERPKHLDPAQSYSEDEAVFTGQIYEPPLQYHYLKRPYALIPGSAAALPEVRLFDARGARLPDDAPPAQVAFSEYEISITPGIRFQPHPAFAQDADGKPRYLNLDRDALRRINTLADFSEQGTRELTADDFVYGIKRLAHPRVHSPIYGMMASRIVGLKALGDALNEAVKERPANVWLDLDDFPLEGVIRLDRYRYRIRLSGSYPQFMYWLAMPFFAPVPRDADRFYSQPGMVEKNLTLDWYPVGTGPYMLTENNPNRRMVLERNPNFRGELYPCEGEPGDRAAGLLDDCGKRLPQIDKAIYTREKESIPYWNKFLQGYYDASGISSDSFDQAVRVNVSGDVQISDEMREKGIRLMTSIRASIFYMGFNMKDGTVGGAGEGGVGADRARKLRQALSIAVDQEEFLSIFMNGRGIPAMGPVPPGISGASPFNPVVYDLVNGAPKRKPVEVARRLLAEAGWPNGRDARTGEPLVLYLDTTGGGLGDKSMNDWITRQFAKLDIQLVVRATDFNRFQDKLKRGAVQIFFLGWNADYPDPENFLFLLAGSEAGGTGGENRTHYVNAEYDRLFAEIKDMRGDGPDAARRLALIERMVSILQHDAPWIYAFHPKSYALAHSWVHSRKPRDVGTNTLKYQRIDVAERQRLREAWNAPVLWPLGLLAVVVAAAVIPAVLAYRRRERGTARS